MRQLIAAVLAVVAALSAVTGCTESSRGGLPDPAPAAEVVIGSFNFDESALIAEIYAQALEHAGIAVRREFRLGPRELLHPALRQGLVDVVPEYLGSALTSLRPPAGTPDLGEQSSVLARLRAALAPWQLTVLAPARASNQNAFAVTRATAQRFGLRNLSDLAAVAPRLVLGGPSECPQRPYCLPGLKRVYGIEFRRFVALDSESQRVTALEQGVIDIAVTFSTDGRLATGAAVTLIDDKRLEPVESVAPVVSRRALDLHGPLLSRTLDDVSAALDQRSLTFLNWRVSVAGKDLRSEAGSWLRRHQLVGAGS
jgi:osmoprotectant transport system substrate-binding protein